MAAMKAHDLFQLGRWLAKIAEDTMRPANAPVTPPGVRLILMDVAAAKDSSIKDITARTGLPQSYVSESVARLREQGVLRTQADPADGRRTLVRLTRDAPRAVARAGAVSVDKALIAALGDIDPKTGATLIANLQVVMDHLRTQRIERSAMP